MRYERNAFTPSAEPEIMPPDHATPVDMDRKGGQKAKPKPLSLAGKFAIFGGLAIALTGVTYVVRSLSPEWASSDVRAAQTDAEMPPAGLSKVGRSGAGAAGVSESEVRFGMVAPFTGPSKELGREMALGLNAAFAEANESGGVAGRRLKLITADDGYEPARTARAVSELHDGQDVLGYVGNVGTATAAVALPYALQNRMLFFGAFTGAESLRATPPDRYVFNYRPSYAEETEAVVRYLVRVRGVRPQEIAVFAQQDAFGDSGFTGVVKALRGLGSATANSTVRLNYVRNSLDLKEALETFHAHRGRIKAVVMVASYRAAAKFIEMTRPENANLIFTNVSFVGSTALADELKLLGPSYLDNVVVTQTVPALSGYSTITLEYRAALGRFFPGEAPDYVSFEAFVDGRLLVEGLRRTNRSLSTETLVNTLENMRGLELGLGSPVSFNASEHQASHKVWGTQLTRAGSYSPIDLD